MEYIRVTKENLEQEHICCAISNNKDVQVSSKKAWLAERFDEGLVFLKSVERGKCFIEYIPVENAWNPIVADNYMYIDCLWVSGSFKGHGYSNDLLDDYFAQGLAARQGVPTVRYFADALNLSANYFGDLVKAQTGNSPQQLIQQHLIAQARHRLTTTTDTVSQIAYALGFEYPQYFSRLFKKQTGLTPQEFRTQA